MRDDHEELLASNPALFARMFWYVARKHGEMASGAPPTLPMFLLSAGVLSHRETVEKIYRMNFESRFLKFVAERPDLLAGLQGRVERSTKAALIALQVGVTCGLLVRDGGEGFPSFRAVGGADLPAPLQDRTSPLAPMFAAARRLGAWFAVEPLEVVQRQLTVEF